ncbi:hypothetical protein EMCRGX_G002028 [Ephydatia muelleri]
MQMLCLHVQAPEDNEDARLMFEGELRALSVEKKGNSYSRSVRLAIKFMLSIPWYWLENKPVVAILTGAHWAQAVCPRIHQCDQLGKKEDIGSLYPTRIEAWKAMTGCDSYVKDGWVLAMKIHYFRHDSNNRCIVMGKVRHSQKINAAPVLPWVVLELNGTVLCAHCTCMAGLGESCSHVAAIICCLVRAAESQKKFGEDACTSKKCSWLPAIKEVAPSEIVTVNFSSSTTDCAKTVSQCKLKPHHVVQPPTDSEIDTFYQTMNSAQLKPSILRIVPEYADQFAPGHLALDLPLLIVCEDTAKDFQVTVQQIENLEQATRGQSSNKLWFQYRSGRITASKFKAASNTNLSMPSQTLIKQICYPEAYKFSTSSTRWGCAHEKDAIQAYIKIAQVSHKNVKVQESGFYISYERPYIGASPDGIVMCDCCTEKVLLEVKCPICVKPNLTAQEKTGFCMKKAQGAENWTLCRDHAYFYQVQAHMERSIMIKMVKIQMQHGVIVEDQAMATWFAVIILSVPYNGFTSSAYEYTPRPKEMNGGVFTSAILMLSPVNPLSAITKSPGSKYFINADLSTISLSDIRPPAHFETKEMVPCGVIPIRNFTVEWCL